MSATDSRDVEEFNGAAPSTAAEADRPPRGGLATALFAVAGPLALGLFGIVLSLQLGLGELNSPGPGLWPLIISVFLTVMSAAGVFSFKRDTDVEAWGSGYLRIGLGLVSLVAYALLFERIGFEIPTLLLLFFWIKVLGREGWRTAIVVSTVATAAAYGLFILALRVNIPHLF
ncbi:tripartite tricarboxylate transporter TctB family protein [Brevibacterium daeguense]|nr:tripartite tricarboxylate transporter TctB family protein [Brevibacterium daeguense]